MLVLAALFGYMKELLWAMVALLFHEGGHVWAAYSSNEPIESLELMPFGAVIRLYERPQTFGREFLIVSAGPAASLVVSTLAAGLVYFFPSTADVLNGLVNVSLMLAAVNLIPAMPLDGGRMLRVLAEQIVSQRTAIYFCAILGLIVSTGLIVLGIYGTVHNSFMPVPFLLAAFLILGGVKELQNGTYAAVVAAMRRGSRISRNECIRMQTVAILANVKARDALRRLKGASLIAVMDDSMHLLGTLSEGDVINAMVRRGADITLGSIVSGYN